MTPDSRFVWGGYYEHGLIWRSRWTTDDGVVECREALALPAHPGRAVLLRRILAREGRARLRVALDLRGEFGAQRAKRRTLRDDGAWTCRIGDVRMTLGGSCRRPAGVRRRGRPAADDDDRARGGSVPRPGAGARCRRRRASRRRTPTEPGARPRRAGRERLPELQSATAPRDARHSYAVLSGLTSSGGGMVAAATMALPERAREGRNYDYRYVWIRDQCFTGQAVAKAGPHAADG